MSDQKLNVCLLNDSFPPAIDGVANAVVNYARVIQSGLGRAVVAVPEYPDVVDDYDFSVIRYPSADTTRLVGYRAGYPFSARTIAALGETGPDIIHSHCPVMSTALARTLREQTDAPVVFTYHTKFDIDIRRAVSARYLRQAAIRLLVDNISACDEVWVVSRGAGDNLRSLGYTGETFLMENGVDVPRERIPEGDVASVTAGYDLPAGVPVFLFVGRLMWYKGLRIILDALASLRESGADFRMVFIGDGADGADVRAYSGKLGLSGRCFFTGAIQDRNAIRAWYSRADLFLFPSTFDTNGLVVREAAACSLAAVLIAGSCAAEGVTDGRNGYLIEENAASLTAKLLSLGGNLTQTRAVGECASRELYISWADAVARAAERYEIVIDRFRSGGYDRRFRPADELLRANGELMTAIGRVEERGEELEQRIEKLLEKGPLYRTLERWWNA